MLFPPNSNSNNNLPISNDQFTIFDTYFSDWFIVGELWVNYEWNFYLLFPPDLWLLWYYMVELRDRACSFTIPWKSLGKHFKRYAEKTIDSLNHQFGREEIHLSSDALIAVSCKNAFYHCYEWVRRKHYKWWLKEDDFFTSNIVLVGCAKSHVNYLFGQFELLTSLLNLFRFHFVDETDLIAYSFAVGAVAVVGLHIQFQFENTLIGVRSSDNGMESNKLYHYYTLVYEQRWFYYSLSVSTFFDRFSCLCLATRDEKKSRTHSSKRERGERNGMNLWNFYWFL